MIEIGTLDKVVLIVGERGMGKSTLLLQEARAFQRETGGYVIGHSPNGQVGAAPDIQFHAATEGIQSKAPWGRGLRRFPERIHIVTRGAPEAVLTYGEALSAAIKRTAFKREHPVGRYRDDRPMPPGIKAPPVLIVIDEGVAMRRNPSHAEMGYLERLLTSARHKHVGIIYSTQAPTARQWVFFEQGSGLRAFRYTHEYGANSLRAAGIRQEVAQSLRDLPRFSYYAFDKLHPERAGYHTLPKP